MLKETKEPESVCAAAADSCRIQVGLACAQAVAMRIDIAPHKRPLQAQQLHRRAPTRFTFPHTSSASIKGACSYLARFLHYTPPTSPHATTTRSLARYFDSTLSLYGLSLSCRRLNSSYTWVARSRSGSSSFTALALNKPSSSRGSRRSAWDPKTSVRRKLRPRGLLQAGGGTPLGARYF